MLKIKTAIHGYLSDENGATAIEYALIAALIAIGIVAGASALGGNITSLFSDVDGEIAEAFGS